MTKEKYIYERPDGTYIVQIKINIDDKRKTISKVAQTLDEAFVIRDQMITIYNLDAKLLKKVVGRKIKYNKDKLLNQYFKDAINEWYETYKEPVIRISTKLSYRDTINRYLIPVFGKLRVKDIDKQMIQYFVNAMLKKDNENSKENKKLSIHTVQLMRVLLTCFFEQLLKEDIIDRNPCKGIEFPQYHKKERDYFTKDEEIIFLEYVKTKSYAMYFLFRFYFETGCRRSEAIGITWDDVDFSNNTIYINKILLFINGKSEFQYATKTDGSTRLLYLNNDTMDYLKQMYKTDIKKGYSKDGLIFRDKNNKPYHSNNISYIFKLYIYKSGVNSNLTLHSTRHTMATKLINKGVAIPVIQKIGGWATAKTLLNIYAHAQIEDTGIITNILAVDDNNNDNQESCIEERYVRKIKCVSTGKIFNCLNDAEKKYNVGKSNIAKCCRGEMKSAGKLMGEKLVWEYVDYVV